MCAFRLRCLLFVAVAGFVTLACGRAEAQAQIAQPSALCLRWTDTCSICERLRESGEIKCYLSLRAQRFDCVAGAVRCDRADDAPVQTQITQPTSWCLRWTDTCTACERRRDGVDIKCTVPARGQRAGCVAGAVRCVMADNAALKDACLEAKTIREPCNTCSPSAPGKPPIMCTLMGCPVKEIVCVQPRV